MTSVSNYISNLWEKKGRTEVSLRKIVKMWIGKQYFYGKIMKLRLAIASREKLL